MLRFLSGGSAASLPQRRVYLNVPFKEKDEAKLLGARFHGDQVKKWYYELQDGGDSSSAHQSALFAKWPVIPSPIAAQEEAKTSKVYLNVPFKDKDQARQLGARFDGARKQWYCFTATRDLFTKWWRHLGDDDQPPLRVYLVLPSPADTKLAKDRGAQYCRSKRRWYYEPGGALSDAHGKFVQWVEVKQQQQQQLGLVQDYLKDVDSFVFHGFSS